MASIQDFMDAEQAASYAMAASMAAAMQPDRKVWEDGVAALRAAEHRAIALYNGEIKRNRHGMPFGGTHPALAGLEGYLDLGGCYAPHQ